MAGSLRLSLVDTQLKHFKLSLQALAKIGTDLLIEALPTRVSRLPSLAECLHSTDCMHLPSDLALAQARPHHDIPALLPPAAHPAVHQPLPLRLPVAHLSRLVL